jgi:hypothetical protein
MLEPKGKGIERGQIVTSVAFSPDATRPNRNSAEIRFRRQDFVLVSADKWQNPVQKSGCQFRFPPCWQI